MKTDAQIQKDVIEELNWEPLLNGTEIGVAVKNGVVSLFGNVDTFNKKASVENAVKRVDGVKALAENVVVKLTDAGKRTDSEISEAIINALKWNTSVPDDKIMIKVENGWVTLEGTVEWAFQSNAVRSAVENLAGVEGITNNIIIIPKIKTADVKRRIMAAFHRNASIDANNINIDVQGNKVILSGKVSSLSEKENAENAAWLAPGINTVENNIAIDSKTFVM